MRAIDFQNWLVNHLASSLGKRQEEIDLDWPFDRFGLDSAAYVSLSAEVEDQFGVQVDVTDLYDHPTIRRFVQHLQASGALSR